MLQLLCGRCEVELFRKEYANEEKPCAGSQVREWKSDRSPAEPGQFGSELIPLQYSRLSWGRQWNFAGRPIFPARLADLAEVAKSDEAADNEAPNLVTPFPDSAPEHVH